MSSAKNSLDAVVVTRRDLPDREPVTIAGVVTQVRARHEGAQFDSDVFAIADGTLPAMVQEAAEITTTRESTEAATICSEKRFMLACTNAASSTMLPELSSAKMMSAGPS